MELGAVDMREEPWNRDDEQVVVRQADASGGDIIENQNEEDRMSDIQVSNGGSEATSEEQSDNLRMKIRFEQEATGVAASPDPTVAPGISCER